MSGRILSYLVVLAGVFNLMEAFLPHELTQYKDQCIEELKLDPSKYVRPEGPPPEGRTALAMIDAIDHDGKCLWRCLLQKYGSVDENDGYHVDKAKKLLPADIADDIDLEKCTALDDEDPCEKSFKRSRCVAEQVFAARQKAN